MILVRDIRLPLDAPEGQAFARALRALGVPRAQVGDLGVAKLSVDARRGQPKLVYTVAVTLRDPAAEPAYAAKTPGAVLHRSVELTLQPGGSPLRCRPVVCGLGPARTVCCAAAGPPGVPSHRTGARPRAGTAGAGGGAFFCYRRAGPQCQYPVWRRRSGHLFGRQAHHPHRR